MLIELSPAGSPPVLHVITTESEVLSALALSAERRHPHSAAMLLAELDRAELCDVADLPPQTVTMNSNIEFIDEVSGVSRVVQLVYPRDADIETGSISILTPIGAGLIGMSAGQVISWPDREGHLHSLRIVNVDAPGRD